MSSTSDPSAGPDLGRALPSPLGDFFFAVFPTALAASLAALAALEMKLWLFLLTRPTVVFAAEALQKKGGGEGGEGRECAPLLTS